MFHQQLCQWWSTFTHVTPYILHLILKNGTLYPYRMKDSAKLLVDDPQSQLLREAANVVLNDRGTGCASSPSYLQICSLRCVAYLHFIIQVALCS